MARRPSVVERHRICPRKPGARRWADKGRGAAGGAGADLDQVPAGTRPLTAELPTGRRALREDAPTRVGEQWMLLRRQRRIRQAQSTWRHRGLLNLHRRSWFTGPDCRKQVRRFVRPGPENCSTSVCTGAEGFLPSTPTWKFTGSAVDLDRPEPGPGPDPESAKLPASPVAWSVDADVPAVARRRCQQVFPPVAADRHRITQKKASAGHQHAIGGGHAGTRTALHQRTSGSGR